MASISGQENQAVKAANASGKTPVVFIPGLWLLPSSWANWADFFKQAGYAPLTPDWPGDPETVEEARANPDVLMKTLKQIADHTADVIGKLAKARRDGGTRPADCSLPDARRPWALGSHGCHRPGRVSRRPAAAPLHAQGVWTFPVESPISRAAPSRSPSTSSNTAGRTPR